MATADTYLKLAYSLPPRLLRFFSRYPPRLPAISQTISTPDLTTPEGHGSLAQRLLEPSNLPNPFRNQKNLTTGRWHDPIFSLRRQADLVKLARAHGVEELLPPTVKGTQARVQKRVEYGLRVKGTGVGQRVKGKAWERMQKGKLNKRKEAMLAMPQLIEDWKQACHFGDMML